MAGTQTEACMYAFTWSEAALIQLERVLVLWIGHAKLEGENTSAKKQSFELCFGLCQQNQHDRLDHAMAVCLFCDECLCSSVHQIRNKCIFSEPRVAQT